ncbi:MAG: sigma-70 family RNA polymerase sigma factor [Clostridiales bacterium]|nr:sigma-70 family RNA polymerase sigma factor [Clostridiales bacterium]
MLFLLLLDSPDDAQFMEDVYKAHYRLMYATALRVLRNPPDAEDAVSAGILSLMKKIDTLRGLPCNKLEAYLVITIKNTAINLYQKRKRTVQRQAGPIEDLKLIDSTAQPEQQAVEGEGLARVKQAIRALPAQEQTAMMLRYLQKLEDSEIADRMGIKPASVRSLISRGKTRLRGLLMEGGETRG